MWSLRKQHSHESYFGDDTPRRVGVFPPIRSKVVFVCTCNTLNLGQGPRARGGEMLTGILTGKSNARLHDVGVRCGSPRVAGSNLVAHWHTRVTPRRQG